MGSPLKTDDDRLRDAMEIIRKLDAEKTLLNRTITGLRRENDTAEKIRQEIYNISARDPDPPEWLTSRTGTGTHPEAPITIWSDWHYGEVVDEDEVGGVNKFNATIAKRRVRTLVDTTIDLAYNHNGTGRPHYPGVIICLGGDMLTGDIHEELLATNDRTPHQAVNDLTDMLAAAIEKMATAFGRAFIPCVVGNHGRSSKKPRFKQRIFTSFEWNIYCNLQRAFKDNKHVKFLISNEADASFAVFGHRYLLTHGDSLGVKGGDGIIGALGPILRGAIKVGASEARIGRHFDTVIMGHWHQYISIPGVIVNNSLIGLSEHGHLALRAPYSRPSQALWFNHPKYGITSRREVFLEELRVSASTKEWVSWQV